MRSLVIEEDMDTEATIEVPTFHCPEPGGLQGVASLVHVRVVHAVGHADTGDRAEPRDPCHNRIPKRPSPVSDDQIRVSQHSFPIYGNTEVASAAMEQRHTRHVFRRRDVGSTRINRDPNLHSQPLEGPRPSEDGIARTGLVSQEMRPVLQDLHPTPDWMIEETGDANTLGTLIRREEERSDRRRPPPRSFGAMSARLRAKRLLIRVADRLAPLPSGVRRVVLCYHSVNVRPGATDPEMFSDQLDWLVDRCDVVGLDELLDGGSVGVSRPAVTVTFDDGFSDNHDRALPALVARGLRALFFITVGFIQREPAVVKRLSSYAGGAGAGEPLSWTQIRELTAAGMGIGGHTWTHPNLARVSDAVTNDELRRSKHVLEDRLEVNLEDLAYPYGKPGRHVTPRIVELARQAGYRRAVAVLYRGVRTSDSRLLIPRFFVTNDTTAELEAKVMGRRDLQGLWQERAPERVARLLAPEDFSV